MAYTAPSLAYRHVVYTIKLLPYGSLLRDMPKERGDGGEFIEKVTEENVLDVFKKVRGPVITSSDVAESLGCSTETARRKLKSLSERGKVNQRSTAGRVVWWRIDDNEEKTKIDSDDPLLAGEPFASGGPSDVAANVDDHLYGETTSNE